MRFPRPAWIAALLALPALAGCVGSEDPAQPQAQAADASVASDAPQAPPPPEAPAPAAAPPRPVEVPLAWDGKIANSACVPSGQFQCTMAVDGDPSFRETVPGKGAPRSIEATLTWKAASPATEKLHFALIVESPSPDGQGVTARTIGEPESGASPLTISEPDLQLAENDTLILYAWEDVPRPDAPAPAPVYYFYSLEQAIRVEGTVTRLVPAEA